MSIDINRSGRHGLIFGVLLLSLGLIGCTTTSRDFEHNWTAGAGGTAATFSPDTDDMDVDEGYGAHGFVRRRISDHFKAKLETAHTRNIDVTNSTDLAEFDATFSTLTAQYEFMPSDNADVRLFVGGGGAYTWFSNESHNSDAGVTEFSIEDDGGGVGEVGLIVPWGFHLKVSRLFAIEPDVSASGGGLSNTSEDQDIWLFSAGLNIPF